jgi:hypothetical protein
VSKYCVVFHRAEDKHEEVVGVSFNGQKQRIPISFTLEKARQDIQDRISACMPRDYGFATIHVIDGEGNEAKVGELVETYQIKFVRVDNSCLAKRIRNL